MAKPIYDNDGIIEAIKKGYDDQVLNDLYKHLYPRIKNYIVKNGGDSDDAQDIFQDGVIILYRHIKTGKYKEEYLIEGFLYKVCRNLWIGRYKKKDTLEIKEDLIIEDESASFHNRLIEEERHQIIQELFSTLGERCKELLMATIFDDLSMKEVAEKLNFATADAAKTKHYKCKQRLIKQIKDPERLKNLLTL